jgi:dUTPase
VYYKDDQTHHIKITTYCMFDEAALMLPPIELPPSARALQHMVITDDQVQELTTDAKGNQQDLKICLLSEYAKILVSSTEYAAGYGMCSARNLKDMIDADSTGKITVVLHNLGTENFNVQIGGCIAQLLVLPITHPTIAITNTISKIYQGKTGFGSTGITAIVHSTNGATSTATSLYTH